MVANRLGNLYAGIGDVQSYQTCHISSYMRNTQPISIDSPRVIWCCVASSYYVWLAVMMELDCRFTGEVRKRGALASRLQPSDFKTTLEVIVEKKQEKDVQVSKRERTVTHLLEEVSAKCNKQEKQRVSKSVKNVG